MFLQIDPASTVSPWYFLWPIGAFLLGAFLTWLYFWRRRRDTEPLVNECNRYRSDAEKYEKDYTATKTRLDESLRTERDLRASLQRCEADKQTLRYRAETAEANLAAGSSILPQDVTGRYAPKQSDEHLSAVVTDGPQEETTGSVFDGLFSPDDFRIFEGVGQRVTEVLHRAGYQNWNDLADADVEDLRRVLAEAGSRYVLSDPSGWPHQAGLAADGKWDELIEYQKFTEAHSESLSEFATDSKFEKLAAKVLGFSSANPNDLKVVEGIGPKLEKVLKQSGIHNWDDLQHNSVDELKSILAEAGDRYRLADPANWAHQASLAAAGDWRALKQLQQRMKEARRG